MKNIFLLILLFLSLFICGQREILSSKLNTSISIDGKLTESDWKSAQWTSNFTQMKPVPGAQPTKKTEVAILYDQEAIYVAAKCYDHPDSISKVLSLRDDFNPNLDVFAVFIDTYQDRQNGFMFSVTSRGVQLDSKIFNNDFNNLFNLAWKSKVNINFTFPS